MENIVFKVEGGIGHNFVCTPTIRKLKEREKECWITVVASFPAVFEKNPYVDEIIPIGSHPTTFENLFKRIHKSFRVFSPSIYSDLSNYSATQHIKQRVGELCGIEIRRDDPLEYYPTDVETGRARTFKEKWTEKGKKKLGVVQLSGSGIGGNPMAELKQINPAVMNQVVEETKDRIFWIQIRLNHEPVLPAAQKQFVDFDNRKLFAMLCEADLGLGAESFSQHIIAGVQKRPYVMVLGRSRKENYAHPSCHVVSNPKSCEYFGCEFPFFNLVRVCSELKCMNSITPAQIKSKLMGVL